MADEVCIPAFGPFIVQLCEDSAPVVVEFWSMTAWKVSGHTGGLTCSGLCGINESNSQDSSDIGCALRSVARPFTARTIVRLID